MKCKLKIVPVHIGIIMDGNGRWATKRGLPRIAGHKEGVKALRKTIKAAQKYGVKYITLYSFSTENWKRPEKEVKFLFNLIEANLRIEGETLHENNVKVGFIGKRKNLPESFRQTMKNIETLTKKNSGVNLIFAINYGGKQEIIEAVKKIIGKKYKKKEITENLLSKFLHTAGIPDPDIIIRTAGEKRLSNFLIWQASYAEFYFTKTLWPDFSEEDFLKALLDYRKRKRKFGDIR